MTTTIEEDNVHINYIRKAIEIAASARANGNHPFGALLLSDDGYAIIAEAENTVITQRDPTGHAETNLVRKAVALFDEEILRKTTLYTSTEPCCMCAGSIYWAGIPRVVYGLPEGELNGMAGPPTFSLPCREVFARGSMKVEVEGPFEVEYARSVHEGFWKDHVNGPSHARK